MNHSHRWLIAPYGKRSRRLHLITYTPTNSDIVILYRAGIDLKTAQYLMGHSTIQMTANVYTHMEKEEAGASIIQLEKFLSGGSQEAGNFSESSQKVVNKE